jgi:hypothetical protein
MATFPSVFAGLTPAIVDGDELDAPSVTNLGTGITYTPDGAPTTLAGPDEYATQVRIQLAATGDWHPQIGAAGFTYWMGGTIRAPVSTVGMTASAAAAAWASVGVTVAYSPALQPNSYVTAQTINGVTVNQYDLVRPDQTVLLAIVSVPVGTTAVRRKQWVTANDIITGALRFINAYSSGESLAAEDAADSLATLNDLLGTLSNDQASVYGSAEAILTFTPGKYVYSIGNYDAGTFAGTVTSGTAVITGASIPLDMVVGGDLSGAGIVPNTTIVAFDRDAQTVTMSQSGNVSPGPQQIGYTVCGDFKAERPLRLQDSFTRLSTSSSGLDYPIEVVSQERYIEIGYKAIGAPWPIAVWYNPTMPLGTLYFYQNPSAAGELHLFYDRILNDIQTLDEEMMIPQGYVLMLKRMLGRALAPEYGVAWTPMQEKLTMEALKAVKALNAQPAVVAKFDVALMPHGRGVGAANWIQTGGFR